MKTRSDAEIVKESRERLKTSPIRYDSSKSLFFWEGIPDCSKKKCPIFKTCQYPKTGVCGLRKRYLSVVERLVLGCIEEKSSKNKLKVGFHLLPLYNQLFVAKLNCIANESAGNLREVRTILRSIEAIFRSLKKKPSMLGEEAPNTPESDFYDQMASTGIEKAKVPAPITQISKRKLKRGPKSKINTSKLDKRFDVL
jgi:hypothetical protein